MLIIPRALGLGKIWVSQKVLTVMGKICIPPEPVVACIKFIEMNRLSFPFGIKCGKATFLVDLPLSMRNQMKKHKPTKI